MSSRAGAPYAEAFAEANTLLWTQVSALGTVAGAIVTSLAIGVTLWIVLTERRERFTTKAELIVTYLEKDQITPQLQISVAVTNRGAHPIYVSYIRWRVGFLSRAPGIFGYWRSKQYRRDLYKRGFPFIVDVNRNGYWCFDASEFVEVMVKHFRMHFGFRMFGKFWPNNIRCGVNTGVGIRYAKIDDGLAQFLVAAEIALRKGALDELIGKTIAEFQSCYAFEPGDYSPTPV